MLHFGVDKEYQSFAKRYRLALSVRGCNGKVKRCHINLVFPIIKYSDLIAILAKELLYVETVLKEQPL